MVSTRRCSARTTTSRTRRAASPSPTTTRSTRARRPARRRVPPATWARPTTCCPSRGPVRPPAALHVEAVAHRPPQRYWVLIAKDASFTKLVATTRSRRSRRTRLAGRRSRTTYPDEIDATTGPCCPRRTSTARRASTPAARLTRRSFLKGSAPPTLLTPTDMPTITGQPTFRGRSPEAAAQLPPAGRAGSELRHAPAGRHDRAHDVHAAARRTPRTPCSTGACGPTTRTSSASRGRPSGRSAHAARAGTERRQRRRPAT